MIGSGLFPDFCINAPLTRTQKAQIHFRPKIRSIRSPSAHFFDAAFINHIRFPNPAVQVCVAVQQLLISAAQPLGHTLEGELNTSSLQRRCSPVDKSRRSAFRCEGRWIAKYRLRKQSPWRTEREKERENAQDKCVKGSNWPPDHLHLTDVWLRAADLSSSGILWEISTLHFPLINCSKSSSLIGPKQIHWEQTKCITFNEDLHLFFSGGCHLPAGHIRF